MSSKEKTIHGCSVLNTRIGSCAIAWRERTITGFQLPESSPRKTMAKLRSRVGDVPKASPPQWVKKVIRQIQQHLRGKAFNFSQVTVALDTLPPFTRRVYQAARRISSGKIATYGQLAASSGSPRAARAVGNALAHNPFPLIVPCHRVLAANGRLGGFSAFGGLKTKVLLLNIEGVKLK